MNILIVGGNKSGKSSFAQKIALTLPHKKGLFYLATMLPCDCEDLSRIEHHRADRAGLPFQTLEYFRRAGRAQRYMKEGTTLLLDSVTSLLSNEMFLQGQFVFGALEVVWKELVPLLDAPGNAVIVSDMLFADAVTYEETVTAFQRTLGHLHRKIADRCDLVIQMRQGIPFYRKGSPLLQEEL